MMATSLTKELRVESPSLRSLSDMVPAQKQTQREGQNVMW